VRPLKEGGRDRTRSISLDGDVAEIAENLARNNLLSRTLSELLRNAYGFASEKERAEARLFELTSQRKEAQKAEEEALAVLEAIHAQEQAKQAEVEAALNATRHQALKDLERQITAKKTWLTHADDTAKLNREIRDLEARLERMKNGEVLD